VPEKLTKPGYVFEPEEGRKYCVGYVRSVSDGPNGCGKEKCEAQFPVGKKVYWECNEGRCPVEADKKYPVACKLDTPPGQPDEYLMRGCLVVFSKVDPCQ